jgi:nitroreductase
VPRAALERCLEAARLAPSACNSQPWKFIVVDEPAQRARLADAAFSGAYTMCTFAKAAPVLVVIETLRSTYAARLGAFWRGVQYNLIDIGIAGEHFVLQATEEGLGTCWLGWFNARAVKKALGLGWRTHIDILISVGYPLDATPREKLRKTLDETRCYGSPAV